MLINFDNPESPPHMQQFIVKPPVSENGVRNEEDGVDLMAFNSSETLGIGSRIKCLFPCRGSRIVAQRSAQDLQSALSVFFCLARLKCDLNCGDGRGNWNADVRCCTCRWACLWLRRNVNLFPVEFIVITVELWGIIMKVVHKMR